MPFDKKNADIGRIKPAKNRFKSTFSVSVSGKIRASYQICQTVAGMYIYNQLKNKIIVRVREDIKIYLSDVLLKSLHHKYINENY